MQCDRIYSIYGVTNNPKPDQTGALQLQVTMYLLQKNDIHSSRKREKLTCAVQAFPHQGRSPQKGTKRVSVTSAKKYFFP